jgi:hypothetical protein
VERNFSDKGDSTRDERNSERNLPGEEDSKSGLLNEGDVERDISLSVDEHSKKDLFNEENFKKSSLSEGDVE